MTPGASWQSPEGRGQPFPVTCLSGGLPSKAGCIQSGRIPAKHPSDFPYLVSWSATHRRSHHSWGRGHHRTTLGTAGVQASSARHAGPRQQPTTHSHIPSGVCPVDTQ